MTNIKGIDPMATGSKDYEQIVKMLADKENSKVEDDETLFKTMQYYKLSGSSDAWSSDASELEIEELIEKWKEFDEEDTSFAKDFDEFDAYMATYKKEDPEPEGGETDKDTTIEFNGVRYEVYKKFNSKASDTLKYYKAEDGRTVFDSDGWNITVIGAMNETEDPNYANVVIEGNENTYFGSNDNDTVEIRGDKNSIHGDALDVGGKDDKVTITSGTGNYIYGEDGIDDVIADSSALSGNFFNKAIKDVEKVNGEEILYTDDIVEEIASTTDEVADETSEVDEDANATNTTVAQDSPQYALTDNGTYHKYTMALLGAVSEDGEVSPPSRDDLAEIGVESEEDLNNPEVFERIRKNSDLVEMLAPMEQEVSEDDPDTLTDVMSVVTAQNVLDMYESCSTGDNKDKEWASRMMALCEATGLITIEGGLAKIAEGKEDATVSPKELFKMTMKME